MYRFFSAPDLVIYMLEVNIYIEVYTKRYNAVIAYFLHLKNHTLVLLKTTLQKYIFTLKCGRIKRKESVCV